MPTRTLTEAKARDAVALVAGFAKKPGYYLYEPTDDRPHSAWQAAAKSTDMDPSTLHHRVKRAWALYGLNVENFEEYTPPESLEDDELPNGWDVLRARMAENTRSIAKARQGRHIRKQVRPEPFAIGIFGDPHLDDPGTDLAQLKSDVDLFRAHGVRCINIGDLLNNFHATGKLAKIQGHSRMSIKDGLAMARWFVCDTGLKWDVHLLGNHDAWLGTDGAELMREWARKAQTRFVNWGVRITYAWDGGEYSIEAAHNFKGSSIHNPVHGLMRRAKEDGSADAYIAGHLHDAAQAGHENGFRGKHYRFVRVGAYKKWDSYAHVNGFPQQIEGHSAMIVVDPLSETMEGRARVFYDLGDGVLFLQALRNRMAA